MQCSEHKGCPGDSWSVRQSWMVESFHISVSSHIFARLNQSNACGAVVLLFFGAKE